MELPVDVSVRGRKKGMEARILQGGEMKFRVDYFPSNEKNETVTDIVLNKVIFRGNMGKISGELEREIREIIKRSKKVFNLTPVKVRHGQYFDGAKREELSGMSAEEYLYNKIVLPEVEECGGKEGDIIPQMSNFQHGRMDFFLSCQKNCMAIEVDDATHNKHKDRDRKRDENLSRIMIKTVRIKDSELENAEKIEKIRAEIRELYKNFVQNKKKEGYVRLKSMAFAMMSLILVARKQGKVGNIWFSEDFFPEIEHEVRCEVARAVIEEMKELERNISEIYSEERKFSEMKLQDDEKSVVIRANFDEKDARKQILFQEIGLPYEVLNYQNNTFVAPERVNVKRENLEFLLKYLFRHKTFRPNQIEGVIKVLEGEDSIVLLPTGSGKSVIYQMAGLIFPGTLIVIEPLKSLMEDQIDNLKRNGINTVGNFSGDVKGGNKERMTEMLVKGAFSMIYVTPERMQMEDFRKTLLLAKGNGVGFPICALDEAHCVSEWGHDFRVSYLNIAGTCRRICKMGDREPVILALTGTASENVLLDMERDLGIREESVVRPGSFDRPEIHYKVFSVASEEKMAALKWLLNEVIPKDFGMRDAADLMKLRGEDTMAGIIFCVYKSGKTDFGVDAVFDELNKAGYPGLTRYYAANEETERLRGNARDFKENRAGLMVATKAFGMGIDKPNIRYTIHFGIPSSIEAYYQEAGRAGRDGKKSMSYIILSNDAPERNGELIKNGDVDDLRKGLKKIGTKRSDDVNRLLFLHQMNYDRRLILDDTRVILMFFGEIKRKKVNIVATSNIEFSRWQKVFFRMKILGIIDDYTISSYANNEFSVELLSFDAARVIEAYKGYVGQYQEGQVKSEVEKLREMRFSSKKEFLYGMMETLLNFVNSVFENSRRRAIGNMLQLAEEVVEMPVLKQDAAMRAKILGHLGNTFKEIIEKIVKNVSEIQNVTTAMRAVGSGQVEGMLMEVKRVLQTYPEHPGLLLMAGVLGAIDEQTNPIVAESDLRQGIESGVEKYGIKREVIFDEVVKMLKTGGEKAKDEKKYRQFLDIFLEDAPKSLKEAIIEALPEKFLQKYYVMKMEKEIEMVFNRIERIELWTKNQ